MLYYIIFPSTEAFCLYHYTKITGVCAYVTGGQWKLFDHESNSGWDRGCELVYTPEKRFGCKYWQKFLTSECHFIAMTIAI